MTALSGDVDLVCGGISQSGFSEDGERAEEEEFAGGIQSAGTGTSSLNRLNVTHLFHGRSHSRWQTTITQDRRDLDSTETQTERRIEDTARGMFKKKEYSPVKAGQWVSISSCFCSLSYDIYTCSKSIMGH